MAGQKLSAIPSHSHSILILNVSMLNTIIAIADRTMQANLIMITWQALDTTHRITQFISWYETGRNQYLQSRMIISKVPKLSKQTTSPDNLTDNTISSIHRQVSGGGPSSSNQAFLRESHTHINNHLRLPHVMNAITRYYYFIAMPYTQLITS